MLLTKLDRQQFNAVSAAKALMNARGCTARGDKLWSQEEDDLIRKTATLTLPAAQKFLPHRSVRAIERRREKLSVSRRQLRAWTTFEDRKLREHIDGCSYVELAEMLPGRSVAAIQGRAWYLGFRKGSHPQRFVSTGIKLVDEIKARARGWSDAKSPRCRAAKRKVF